MSKTGKIDWASIEDDLWAATIAAVRAHGGRGWVPVVVEKFAKHNVSRARLTDFLWRTKTPARDKARREAEKAWAAEQAKDAPPAEPPMDPAHPELRKAERTIRDLRERNQSLERKLATSDTEHSAFERAAEVVQSYASDRPIELRPLAKLSPRPEAHPVDAIVVLSDEHADQVIHGAATWGVERYNFDVFRLRLERWRDVVASYLTQHLPAHRFERLWVFKLGDGVNGDIHDAKHRNHFANSLRAALALGDAEAEAVASLSTLVPGGAHVVSISGNHPRQTKRKDYDDAHDNLDFIVATQMATRLDSYVKAGRVSVHVPKSYSAYVDVRGHLCALNHGDDVKGTWGIPWYGFSKREGRVQALVSRHDERVKYFFYGHFHTPLSKTDGDSTSFHSGAFTLTSPYGMEALAVGNDPVQQMYVVDDRRGCVLQIPIFLRDEAREEAYWGEHGDIERSSPGVLEMVAGPDRKAARGTFPKVAAPPLQGEKR